MKTKKTFDACDECPTIEKRLNKLELKVNYLLIVISILGIVRGKELIIDGDYVKPVFNFMSSFLINLF